jgi:phenylalanyl-tRNA synthetase beta chain
LLEETAGRVWPGAALEPGAGVGAQALGAVGGTAGGLLSTGEGWTVVDESASPVGSGGRIDPRVLDLPPWAGAVYGFELDLPELPAPRADPVYRALPSYPGVERDVALLVPDDVAAARVQALVREAGGALLVDVEPFDVFRGRGVPEGARSLAYRFRFRSPERTLTDDEVERATATILDRLGEELRVQVRR